MACILTIDDDVAVRTVVAYALRRCGYTVWEATDGAEGIVRVLAHAPDLVITDLVMPNREGIETIIELRRDFPRLPVIAMSGGDGALHNLKVATLLGAGCILPKPFTVEQLLEAVATMLPVGRRDLAANAKASDPASAASIVTM